MTGLPILRAHDPHDVVGVLTVTADGRYFAEFKADTVPLAALEGVGSDWIVRGFDENPRGAFVRHAELVSLGTSPAFAHKTQLEKMKMPTPDPVRMHLSWLGRRVRDKVTGARGIVTSVCFDLYGCVCGLITPPRKADEEKDPPAQWYDVKRLEQDGDEPRVLEPPDHFLTNPGTEAGPEHKPGMPSQPVR